MAMLRLTLASYDNNTPGVQSTRAREAQLKMLAFADLKLEQAFATGRMGEVFEGHLRNHTSVIIRRVDNKSIDRTALQNEIKTLR